MFGDDAFDTERFADCAALESPACALVGRSDDVGNSVLPAIDMPDASTTDTLPGTYVAEGTVLFDVDTSATLLGIGGLGK